MTEAWWGWIAPVSVQAALLLLLVAVLDRLLRRRVPAKVRMALWMAALLRLALPADLSSPASLTAPLAAALPEGDGGGVPVLLPILWLAGAVGTIAFWILREGRERRRILGPLQEAPAEAREALLRAARRAGLRAAPALAVSHAAEGPCLLGTFRPVVVLPAGLRDGEDLDAALLHECVHIRRGDPFARAAVRLLAAAFWFHPLVHLAVRRTEALRESCCDGTVAELLGPDTPRYREALLRAAERLVRPRRRPAPALGLLGGGDGLADRLVALEGSPWRGARARTAGALVAGSFVLGCLAPMAEKPAAAPDRSLAEARAVLAAAERGERQSCWSVRFAGMRIAAEPDIAGDGGRP